jgi:hypothetical protein
VLEEGVINPAALETLVAEVALGAAGIPPSSDTPRSRLMRDAYQTLQREPDLWGAAQVQDAITPLLLLEEAIPLVERTRGDQWRTVGTTLGAAIFLGPPERWAVDSIAAKHTNAGRNLTEERCIPESVQWALTSRTGRTAQMLRVQQQMIPHQMQEAIHEKAGNRCDVKLKPVLKQLLGREADEIVFGTTEQLKLHHDLEDLTHDLCSIESLDTTGHYHFLAEEGIALGAAIARGDRDAVLTVLDRVATSHRYPAEDQRHELEGAARESVAEVARAVRATPTIDWNVY